MAAVLPPNPPPYTASREPEREDWEDWEDDEPITPIDAGEQVLISIPPPQTNSVRLSRNMGNRTSRHSVIKIKRLKSRHRQKAQNAKAGIKVITDMAAFRRQTQQLRTPDGRPVKFVDAAALRALEGEPTSASVGNWNWLKRKGQSPASASPLQQPARSPDQNLSPEDRPIVIGIAIPSDDVHNHEVTPQTATLQTPIDPPHPRPTIHVNQHVGPQQKSVWSPDTPDTASSFATIRYNSSVYSHMPSPIAAARSPSHDVPPVPAVPANFKKTQHRKLVSLELGKTGVDEDESGTPCTLFEEDGIPSPQKNTRGKGSALTPDSALSRSHGWWDHVVTPFMDKNFSFVSRKQRMESPREDQEEWWSAGPEQKPAQTAQYLSPTVYSAPFQTPIVREPTPRRSPTPRSEITMVDEPGPSAASTPALVHAFPISEKPRIVVTDETHEPQEVHIEQPPPYSPPSKREKQENREARERLEREESMAPVRYRAVFPPGHPLHAQFPPSPGPVSPGLSVTMTSQGATQMMDIPLTPGPHGNMPLPTRAMGTFVPQEHSHETSGEMSRTERRRRRHEKEEVLARKAGGFWRGRSCIPKKGCFGRTGREGRQRRRVWMIVLGILLLLMILGIVLGVVLTRPHHTADVQTIWVNLTDFPPMPTGVMTVVGPDNSVSKSGCTEPSTLWSCSLPKDQHDSVSPYSADQPTVIMQIQWDNSSSNNWNVSDGTVPTPIPRRSLGGAVFASSMVRERATQAFNPSPDAPEFQEEWFLGNTTDDIKSDDKAGEATPFYISLLDSLDSVDESQIVKRDTDGVNISISNVLPSPDLNSDGTPKPAVLLPTPSQQPVRLYDRGLPTEHYGFYSYFKRTIFLKSVTVVNKTDEDVPLDENGGCKETEADFLATWSQTRVLVQIWTKTLSANTSTLLSSDGQSSIDGNSTLIRPGTMPYPVTVTLDTHGGDPTKKFVWAWPMDDRQQLNQSDPTLLANKMDVGGTWINKRSRGDAKYGGYDGGTGGCKCQWVNWVQLTKS